MRKGKQQDKKIYAPAWKQDFKREIPNVKLGQKPEGFSVEDTPLISLGMEGLNGGA